LNLLLLNSLIRDGCSRLFFIVASLEIQNNIGEKPHVQPSVFETFDLTVWPCAIVGCLEFT